MRALFGAALLCAAMAVGGCGGDDDSPGDKKPVTQRMQFGAAAGYQGPPLGNGNTFRPPPPAFFAGTQCRNPQIEQAVKEFSKTNVTPVRGPCNAFLYNKGRWKTATELRALVEQRMRTCGDPYVSRAVAEVYNTYDASRCNVKLYHGGEWGGDYEQLRGYVLDYFCTNAPPKNDINRKDIICNNGETQKNR